MKKITKKIGIVGAGVMGRSIAQAFVEYGYVVHLYDIQGAACHAAAKEIFRNIRMRRMLGSLSDISVSKPESLLVIETDPNAFSDMDFLIESVTEDIAIKRTVLRSMDATVKPTCIFMTNTSCISITKLASCTDRAMKFIGAHFMNPVPQINTVEVIRGLLTDQETIDETASLLETIGKQYILVNDMPGFVSNRISHLMMNEAVYIVQDQVAQPQDVDRIFKECYGHRLGPLETADLIGLDTVVLSLDVLYQSYQDTKYRCCPLLRKMVDAGLYGVKSGQGFYSY